MSSHIEVAPRLALAQGLAVPTGTSPFSSIPRRPEVMPPRPARPRAAARGRARSKKRRIIPGIGEIVPDSDEENVIPGIGEIVPESDAEKKPRQKKRRPNEPRRSHEQLAHPSLWFDRTIADELWMPDQGELERVAKPQRERRPRRPRQRHSKKHWNKGKPGKGWHRRERGRKQKPHAYVRERVPDSQRSTEPLLTSWFEVGSLVDEQRPEDWRTNVLPADHVPRSIIEELRSLHALVEPDERANSVIKIKLYPTRVQSEKLDQMFAANRAVYNKLVGLSRDDIATRVATRSRTNKMTIAELGAKYRPVSQMHTMSRYFRNKRGLARHLQVHSVVHDSAFRDFMKAVRSSVSGYFGHLAKNEATTFPELKFKSKFAPSNTIELHKRLIRYIEDEDGATRVRFAPEFFGFDKRDGIIVHEREAITMSVRLQRLRDGDYYLVVPRKKEFQHGSSDRICALDPGVRNFITLYDPDGRTLSIPDTPAFLQRKFEYIDAAKSTLQQEVNACKARHRTRTRSRRKRRLRHEKTSEHRKRYRLRRRIRLTSRKATRCVNDMHHKLAKWLASSYYMVLLPSFHTSEMVQKHLASAVASDAIPATTADDVQHTNNNNTNNQQQQRVIRSPTARAMMAQAHFRFKTLLTYKMARAGGYAVRCEEEYTSKTCSSCGTLNDNLGGSSIFRCPSRGPHGCNAVLDRDINAAKNILIKNRQLLR